MSDNTEALLIAFIEAQGYRVRITRYPEVSTYKVVKDDNADFHRLWTSCVGTKHYNKKAWLDIEHQLCNKHIPIDITPITGE